MVSISFLKDISCGKSSWDTHVVAVVAIVNGPPSTDHLIVGSASGGVGAALNPRLLRANEVDQVDARLEVLIGRNILVVGGGRDIVGEAQAVVSVPEVHVQETLIGSVERDSPLGHSQQGVVITHVGRQNHDTSVEQVGPADIGSGGESVREVEELIGSPISDNVGIDVDDLAELGLLPEVDLGEGRVQIRAVHEEQVGRSVILNRLDGDDIVVDGLVRS